MTDARELDTHPSAVLPSVVIIGADTVLAASPATPVQLAHACLRRGFDVAVPASWGDELVAAEAVRRLAKRERGPAVFCACPFVDARLRASGSDLESFVLSIAPPPLALARYLRTVYGAHGVRLTYVGDCPSARDSAIDAQMSPMEFFADLATRGISLVDQPRVFESVVPPDRRRWSSLPGGAPAPELLWSAGARLLVELTSEDISSDLAQALLANDRSLIDIAPAVGCVCSGATSRVAPADARATVVALEPPRSPAPVIDVAVKVSFDSHFAPHHDSVPPARVSVSARRESPPQPLEITWTRRSTDTPSRALTAATEAIASGPIVPERVERDMLVTAAASVPLPASKRKATASPGVRHNSGGFPKTRSTEGRPLPRGYAAKRKSAQGLRIDSGEREVAHAREDAERAISTSIEPVVSLASAVHPAAEQRQPPAVVRTTAEPERVTKRVASEPAAITSNVVYIVTVLAFVGLAVVVLRSLFH